MPAPYRLPASTVDVVVEVVGGVVLVERAHEPLGWALPGGFVDYDEVVADAAVREVREETGLAVTLTALLGVYSDPKRDPRKHTISTVFVGRAEGTPVGADDARSARVFPLDALPPALCFDHALILDDYREYLRSGVRPVRR